MHKSVPTNRGIFAQVGTLKKIEAILALFGSSWPPADHTFEYRTLFKLIHTIQHTMPKHFLLRIGNGFNFRASSARHIWGIVSKYAKFFLEEAKEGDILWFIQADSNGLAIAVATYVSSRARGPSTLTSEELGWTDPSGGHSDTEIHYRDLYDLSHCGLETNIQYANGVRRYESEGAQRSQVDLPAEYPSIVRYSKVVPSM